MAWWEAGARILLAILIGLAIGYERERRNKPAGTRTHILVCLGAALIAVMENYVEARVLAINTDVLNTGVAVSMGRISAQVVSGIGFLGAGTIFSSRKKIAGLTTAASLWCAGTCRRHGLLPARPQRMYACAADADHRPADYPRDDNSAGGNSV